MVILFIKFNLRFKCYVLSAQSTKVFVCVDINGSRLYFGFPYYLFFLFLERTYNGFGLSSMLMIRIHRYVWTRFQSMFCNLLNKSNFQDSLSRLIDSDLYIFIIYIWRSSRTGEPICYPKSIEDEDFDKFVLRSYSSRESQRVPSPPTREQTIQYFIYVIQFLKLFILVYSFYIKLCQVLWCFLLWNCRLQIDVSKDCIEKKKMLIKLGEILSGYSR